MPKSLKLTLVIPVFNDESHLKSCLDSVERQTTMPDEVIIVDNNCSDKSMSIAKKYSFVKIIKENKQGVLHARTAGFNSVTGDIIGRIDSDTILPNDWVEEIKKFYFKPNNLNSAFTGGCYFYNIRLPHLNGWWQGQIAFRFNRLLLGHYILFGSNMAFTKLQWLAVRNKVCNVLDVHEDLDLAIHLHQIGYKITYQERLRVGVAMKRVRSRRGELWDNLIWWPKTLRRHGKKTWVLGYIGSMFLFVLSPVVPISEILARVFGRSPIND